MYMGCFPNKISSPRLQIGSTLQLTHTWVLPYYITCTRLFKSYYKYPELGSTQPKTQLPNTTADCKEFSVSSVSASEIACSLFWPQKARIILVHKSCDREYVNNYRPISILPVAVRAVPETTLRGVGRICFQTPPPSGHTWGQSPPTLRTRKCFN